MHRLRTVSLKQDTKCIFSSSIHKPIQVHNKHSSISKSSNIVRLMDQTLIWPLHQKHYHRPPNRKPLRNKEETNKDKYYYAFEQDSKPTNNFSSVAWTPPAHILIQRYFANKPTNEPVSLNDFSVFMDELIPPSASGIAASCSGGSDSMALTLLANDYCKRRNIPFVALIVDHKLRENSTTEANHVKSMLQQRGIDAEILTLTWDDKPKSKIQDLSRSARYQIVNARCKELKIPFVLTGHHMEDQVETLIMRIAMQTGTEGVTPFKYFDKDIAIVRPLLCFTKPQLRATCESYGQEWVEDPSNKLETYFRNRVRKTLEEEVYSQIPMDTFASLIYDMKEVRYMYAQRIIDFCKGFLRLNSNFGFCTIPLSQVQRLDIAYASRFLLRLIRFFTGSFSALHVHLFEAILRQLRQNHRGSKFSCSGILLIPQGEYLFITREKLENPKLQIESGQTLHLGNWEVTYKMIPSKIPGAPHPMSNRTAFVKRMNDKEWKQLLTLHPSAGFEHKNLPYDVRTNIPILVDNSGNLLATPHFRFFSDGIAFTVRFKPPFDIFTDDENFKQLNLG